MLDIVHEHLDKVLSIYTQGPHFDNLKEAKEKYFSITGKLDEDKDEFESRMNCFNDWYIFQYRHKDGSKVMLSTGIVRPPPVTGSTFTQVLPETQR